MQLEYTITEKQQEVLFRLKHHLLNSTKSDEHLWDYGVSTLFDLGIGMEETLNFVYYNRPSDHEFIDWIAKHANAYDPTIDHDEQEDVLSEEDLDFWEDNGYIVIKQAISQSDCKNAANAIWEFLDASPDNKSSWYKSHPAKRGMMVLFTQHQALHKIRNSVKIRKAYEQLYGTTEIYKTIDKVSFNPPEDNMRSFLGSPLHWDVRLSLPIPYKLQGLLYLNNVSSNGGAFQCVPGFHLEIDCWLNNLPAGVDAKDYAQETLHPITIPGNAGDFIIWNQSLPHSATPNKSNTPRLVQYLTYLPSRSK